MHTVKEKRAAPGFPLIRSCLSPSDLPVKGSDSLNCWENIEWGLLCMDDDSFNTSYSDWYFNYTKKKVKTETKQIAETVISESRKEEIPQVFHKFEDMFNNEVSPEDILDMLNSAFGK